MKLTSLLIATSIPVFCMAQTDSTVTTDSTSKATLTLGASYSNNASYYGQRAQENMPYIAASATYRLRSGIYFTGMGLKLLNDSGSAISATSLGAGISFPSASTSRLISAIAILSIRPTPLFCKQPMPTM